MKTEIVERDPSDLRNHIEGIRLFGEHVDEFFLDCVRKYGVIDPLLICRSTNPDLNDRIVSGRRRRMAAIILGLPTVPCRYWSCDNPDEIRLRMIICNMRSH